jgi:hypothetical protein
MTRVQFDKVPASEALPTDDEAYFVLLEFNEMKSICYYDRFHKCWRDLRTDDIESVEYWYKPIK